MKRLLLGGLLVLSACGPASTSSAQHGSSSNATSTPVESRRSAEAAATPAPQPRWVWAVTTSAGLVVRISPPGGGFSTLATLPIGSVPMAAGGHFLIARFPDGHLHGLNLTNGHISDYGGDPNYIFFGGAFAPDGSHFAYVRSTSATDAGLRVLDVTTGSVVALHTFPTNTYDVPQIWGSSGIGTNTEIGYADAGIQGVALLDAASGTRLLHTDTPSVSPIIGADLKHVADAGHTDLGDSADAQGPGPQGPFNTLRAYTIGTAPTSLLQEAHHNITVLAVSADGSRIVFYDDTAAGGFAGISLSPDFGLFVWSGGSRTQLDKYGNRWDAATFVGSTEFLASRHTGTTEQLVDVFGTTINVLDTMTSDGPAQVYSVAG